MADFSADQSVQNRNSEFAGRAFPTLLQDTSPPCALYKTDETNKSPSATTRTRRSLAHGKGIYTGPRRPEAARSTLEVAQLSCCYRSHGSDCRFGPRRHFDDRLWFNLPNDREEVSRSSHVCILILISLERLYETLTGV